MRTLTRIETSIPSRHLRRMMRLSILIPPGYYEGQVLYPVLYLNDGQDITGLSLESTIAGMLDTGKIPPFITVGIHATADRLSLYGTAHQADFAGRGDKAAAYTHFILQELKPYLAATYRIRAEASSHYFAGCSLGGLSAMDIVWNHPEAFSRVGVFSGSFWWRSRDIGAGYVEATDRMMHAQVRAGMHRPGLKYWFEAGTDDETSDRNQNGIIDAIEDTLDLMWELWKKGYQPERDMRYHEVVGGEHNLDTWARAMPHFLTWLFDSQPE